MGDLGRLVEGIRQAPEDPLPRLVCADWLEENDRPARAELIRVQCRLVGMAPRLVEYTALRVREARLVQEAIDEEPGWPPELVPGDFDRGFRCRMTCAAKDLPLLERDDLPPMPVDALAIHSLVGRVAETARSPILGRVRSLTLGDGLGTWSISRMFGEVDGLTGIGGRDFGEFLAAADLSRLESLTVEYHHRIGPEGLAALTRTRLPRLRELALVAQGLADRDIERLASAPWLGQLDSLTLWGNHITPVGAGFLASRLAVLSGLKSLDLSGNPLRGEGVASLLRSPWIDRLEALKLADCGLDDLAFRTLARSAALRNLRELDLSGEPNRTGAPDGGSLTHAGIAAIARSEFLAGLVGLSLNDRNLGAGSVERLGRGFPKLETLSIHSNPLGVAGAVMLTRADWWEELTSLNLAYAGLEDSGIDRMWREAPLMLRELDLNGNGIANRGAGLLSRPAWLANLLTLRLHNNLIGAVGARSIARSASLENLIHLRLGSNPLRQRTVDALIGRYGHRVRF